MRLPRPFYRLPVRFDAARLQAELEALPDIGVGAAPEGVRRKCVDPPDQRRWRGKRRHARRHAADAASAGVPVRAAGARELRRRVEPVQVYAPECPVERARARGHELSLVSARALHIPVITWPEVTFSCGDESVHMAAGEAWLFDNWRRHSVVNPTDHDRVHLVADTFGNSRFWQYVGRERRGDAGGAAALPSGIRCARS